MMLATAAILAPQPCSTTMTGASCGPSSRYTTRSPSTASVQSAWIRDGPSPPRVRTRQVVLPEQHVPGAEQRPQPSRCSVPILYQVQALTREAGRQQPL